MASICCTEILNEKRSQDKNTTDTSFIINTIGRIYPIDPYSRLLIKKANAMINTIIPDKINSISYDLFRLLY